MNNLHLLVVASVLSVGIVTTSSLLLTTLNPQAATHLLLTVEIFSMFTGASLCVGAFSLLLDSLMTICAFNMRQNTIRFIISKFSDTEIIAMKLGVIVGEAQPAGRADSCTATDAAQPADSADPCATPDASEPADSADTPRFIISKFSETKIFAMKPAGRADSCTATDAAQPADSADPGATPEAADPVDSADAGATGAGAGKAQDTGEISDDAASGADTV
jgi:hypothetical protein